MREDGIRGGDKPSGALFNYGEIETRFPKLDPLRVTPSDGYGLCQRIRKRIEEGFGWIKAVAGRDKTKLRGCDRVGFAFTFGAAACNLFPPPKLLAAARTTRPRGSNPPRFTCPVHRAKPAKKEPRQAARRRADPFFRRLLERCNRLHHSFRYT